MYRSVTSSTSSLGSLWSREGGGGGGSGVTDPPVLSTLLYQHFFSYQTPKSPQSPLVRGPTPSPPLPESRTLPYLAFPGPPEASRFILLPDSGAHRTLQSPGPSLRSPPLYFPETEDAGDGSTLAPASREGRGVWTIESSSGCRYHGPGRL